jgi:hypothetical protein
MALPAPGRGAVTPADGVTAAAGRFWRRTCNAEPRFDVEQVASAV